MAGYHHVRFSQDTHLDPDPVHVTAQEGGVFEAHLGLLRNHHTYRAEVRASHSLGENISAAHGPCNIHVTVITVPDTKKQEGGGDKYNSLLNLQVKTTKDGDISEKVKLYNDEDVDGGMEIVVTAKVLKSNQGNPVLKDGVHIISHEHTEESDFTEWPGTKVTDDDD